MRQELRLSVTLERDSPDESDLYAQAVAWYLAMSPSAREYMSSALIARFPRLGLAKQFETEHFTMGTRALLHLEQQRHGAAD